MTDYKKQWRNIAPAEIEERKLSDKFRKMELRAKSVMDQRTRYHGFYSKVSHMQSLYENKQGQIYSEGSTQAIKRKIRAETIQRVPDGQILTQHDKNSIEQIEIEFLFQNKILTSEYDRKDMLKNLWRTFNASYDYGYACVRTGFEKDLDGDYRVTYNLIQWNDVLPAPDCAYIEEADWYLIREWVSRSQLEQLIDWENGTVKDPTYEEKTVQYLLGHDIRDAVDPRSLALADRKKHQHKNESVETYTLYKRGKKEFITWVPAVSAVLRRVPNYDPRKDIPLHFLILEPDPDWPLGCSSIMFTMAQQQFADAFQTLSYQTLLLAVEPPLMGFGNLTPQKLRMKPRSYWPMGTNQNNRVEPFRVETTTLTQYGSILQNVSGNMMRNLNVTEANVASDAQVNGYSATPQGVEMQKREKTVTVNQYQKRLEIFFAEWANHALRSYLGAMGGKQELTVDEHTRRRILDYEAHKQNELDANDDALAQLDPDYEGSSEVESIVDGDKITIDFTALKSDVLEFKVRTGSLVESETDKEREDIQGLIVSLSQMLNGVSDENKTVFEKNIMHLVARLLELSNIDISQQLADRAYETVIPQALQATMDQVMQQQGQLAGMQGQLDQIGAALGAGQQPVPPEGMPPAPEGVSPEGLPPMPPEAGMPPEGMPPVPATPGGAAESPNLAPSV